MITAWAPLQRNQHSGGAAAMIEYQDAPLVRKKVSGSHVDLVRDPVPERLLGHPGVIAALIAFLPFKKSFQLVTLSFAKEDIPVAEFNAGTGGHRERVGQILRLFLETAAPGIPPALRPPIFVNTHTHTGRLEVNILIPGMALRPCGQVMAYNPNPPGKAARRRWDAFTDTVNGRYGFADPRGFDHMRLVGHQNQHLKLAAEARRHGVRIKDDDAAAIASEALLLYDCNSVDDRDEMLAALQSTMLQRDIRIVEIDDAGVTFSMPCRRRLRLTGHLFSAGFHPHNPIHDLTEIEYRTTCAERLKTAPVRLRHELELCAVFNRDRYRCDHPLPDPQDTLRRPPLLLPPRHTGHPLGKRMTPVLSRLVSVMAAVLNNARQALQRLQILRAFDAADFHPFTKLRHHLETINDRHETAARHHGTVQHHSDPRRSDRAAPDDTGDGRGTRDRRPAGPTDLRSERNPGPDAAGRGHHGTGTVAPRHGPGAGGADGKRDGRDTKRRHPFEGMVRRPPHGSRADFLIRLRSEAAPISSVTLRGTSGGGIRVRGVGFSATIGDHQLNGSESVDEVAAARLAALLEATGLAPPPENVTEASFDFG